MSAVRPTGRTSGATGRAGARTAAKPPTAPTGRTSAPKPRPSTVVTPSTTALPAAGPVHKLPGPRFYRLIRAGLVVLTLLSSLVCVIGVQMSQSSQTSVADHLVSVQGLRDLQSEAARAESTALIWLVRPTDATWDSYQLANDQIDLLLMTSAASVDRPGDLAEVASALRNWQEAVTIAHYHGGTDAAAIQTVLDRYDDLSQALARATSDSAGPSDNQALVVVGLVFAVIAALGFVCALVLVALRSHRVVNLGLAAALAAIIGIVSVMGVYYARPHQILAMDSETARLSQAVVDTWDARSLDALAVLLPDRGTLPQATALVNSLYDDLASQGLPVDALLNRQQYIIGISDIRLLGESDMVTDAVPWRELADAIGAQIDDRRSDPHDLILSAQWSLATVCLLGVAAAIATLAGINSRTKEYR